MIGWRDWQVVRVKGAFLFLAVAALVSLLIRRREKPKSEQKRVGQPIAYQCAVVSEGTRKGDVLLHTRDQVSTRGGRASLLVVIAIILLLSVAVTQLGTPAWVSESGLGPGIGIASVLGFVILAAVALHRFIRPEAPSDRSAFTATLAEGLAAFALVVGLIFTWYQVTTTSRTAAESLELTEKGQLTERFTRAAEQLGSESIVERVGGIYSLEQIARDSPTDRQAIIDVIGAFIRQQAPLKKSTETPAVELDRPPEDIQASLTVLGRIAKPERHFPIDIRESYLVRVDLVKSSLDGARFNESMLIGANFREASLIQTQLSHANLREAIFIRADLTRASLADADMSLATFTGAQLVDVYAAHADFRGARLQGANLTRANLVNAKLSGADLSGADLRGALVTSDQLNSAILDEYTRLPGDLEGTVIASWSGETPALSIAGDIDCGYFSSQEEAQSYFEAAGGSASNNIDGLDGDGDGIVCEIVAGP